MEKLDKNNMRLIQKTDMLGDATYWLMVINIPSELTVKEAISWIVDLKREEFGSIYIETANREKIARYSHGNIKEKISNVYRANFDKKVDKIEANGGWGNMDYYITLKPTMTETETNKNSLSLKKPKLKRKTIYNSKKTLEKSHKLIDEAIKVISNVHNGLKQDYKELSFDEKDGPKGEEIKIQLSELDNINHYLNTLSLRIKKISLKTKE